MITTSASAHYTPLALRTFLAATPLGERDLLVLIDNDGDFALPSDLRHAPIALVRPERPRSFAANANRLLAEARSRQADLFLLNNDLVFTHGWLAPLLEDRHAIVSPLSNAQVTRTVGGWSTKPAMELTEYLGHEADVEAIAQEQQAQGSDYRPVAALAFFCVKIPRRVYDVVGDFDEQYAKAGGEDRDYAVRAWIAGIPQEYAGRSYVLHFQGKSTWRGSETPEQQQARDAQYTQAFQKKWGAALTYAFLGGDWNLFRSDPVLAPMIARGDFTALVRRLRSRPSLDPHITRQRHARFAAVCCLYDDDSWLSPAIESIYEACSTIWFLVGERPWNGEPTDQSALVARLADIADPDKKVRLVRGTWPSEAAQRNEGLRHAAGHGADYCFVVDADEIYDPAQLRHALTVVRDNPQVDCWRASCFTYWKSYRYRVDPPETITAAVFVRLGTGHFVDNRTFHAARHANLPIDTLAFHHMSYARTDEQILRKITTFGHAREVIPGWYENVWRRWDHDRTLENLNPCWPAAYRRIVEQRYDALPPGLRRMWDAEEQAAHRATA